jgi:glucose/arabinose dehydrogenase
MRRLHRALVASLLLNAITAAPGLGQAPSAPRPIREMDARDWSVAVVTDNLDYPWDIVRSEIRLIVTEARGTIVVLEGDQLRRYPLQTSDPVAREGGSGLLGIALSADFATSGAAYLYHSYRTPSGLTNKVIQARFDGDAWRETRVLLSDIPGHPLYNGGRLAIGPDGLLYVTTGWTEDRQRPQDLGNLAGKVLRMTLDGEVPPTNPFPGSYVYSLGHRNPQGLAWNAAGELLVAEHGQSARDEINLIRPGQNYGWPLVSGAETREGLQEPLLQSGSTTWAPSGIAFAGSELLVAALGQRALLVLDEATKTLRPVFSSGDRLRQVLPVGRDVYVITTNRSPRADGPSQDRLLRLSRH